MPRKLGHAPFHVGAHSLGLVSATDQRFLFDRFSQQQLRIGGTCRCVEQSFGGPDCLWTSGRDVVRETQRLSQWVGGQAKISDVEYVT